ncbi:pre-mRNA cleavage and polyadenylation factor (CPF) complex subunit [Scheffersomyces spartinae]|uniref:Polyadenylation factor subunit 2 n=1 Tax=Scheffersomyces spartinae TaxID=45513 RepID=A0A9P8AKR1_9ASCO|nr:pre-mRNA cleavage and polyadenylation factor (CPF) complex subunit [Scheffersomyces spartinae]KAG7195362.1 pre-mRNA cleavage and polyadenylation factor (CPF) complex subunit [Scheffersomyces spartinae]
MYGNRPGHDNPQNSNEPPNSNGSRLVLNRRTVDHGNSMGRWHLYRLMGLYDQSAPTMGVIRPESSYLMDLLPSAAYAADGKSTMAAMDLQTKFVHLSSNKAKHSINTVKWTPEGRRLLVASHSGEFTLWNGMTFNFETIMQAHDTAVLSLKYSHSDEWLLSGDQNGCLKYWQPNFNNVNILNKAHADAIRDIAFSPNDSKFLTCSDDSTVKIWNFNNGQEERTLVGHHWDVKLADWHPTLGLIVTGSKDNLIKLWDPRSSNCISTLHGFKHTVSKTRFQTSGNQRLLAGTSRDKSCRVFDLRTMRDLVVIRDHDADVSGVSWHPIHGSILTTGAYNGSLHHYVLDTFIPDGGSLGSKTGGGVGVTNASSASAHQAAASLSLVGTIEAVHKIPYAHEKAIHAVEYHPLGHLLCTAGVDRTARFWSRARPNDPGALNDALYTDQKSGAWYYAVNNNVNAVIDSLKLPGSNGVGEGGDNLREDGLPGLPGLRM